MATVENLKQTEPLIFILGPAVNRSSGPEFITNGNGMDLATLCSHPQKCCLVEIDTGMSKQQDEYYMPDKLPWETVVRIAEGESFDLAERGMGNLESLLRSADAAYLDYVLRIVGEAASSNRKIRRETEDMITTMIDPTEGNNWGCAERYAILGIFKKRLSECNGGTKEAGIEHMLLEAQKKLKGAREALLSSLYPEEKPQLGKEGGKKDNGLYSLSRLFHRHYLQRYDTVDEGLVQRWNIILNP